MFDDNGDPDKFRRMIVAFRNKFDLSGLDYPELIQRYRIVNERLVNNPQMAKNQRALLKIAKHALAQEIHQRNLMLKEPAKKRWEN